MSTLGANAVVLNDAKVLLVLRNDFDVWALPGGHVDDGESVSDAVLREVREETGLSVRIRQLVGVYSKPRWLHGGDHTLAFLCDSPSGTLLRRTDETADAEFFEPGCLTRNTWPPHREVIADALAEDAAAQMRTQNVVWPFGDEVGWADVIRLYREKDEAVMSWFRQMMTSWLEERK